MNSVYTIKKASFFKRVLAFIIDAFLVFGLFVLIENYVMHPILNKTSNMDQIDAQFKDKLVEYNIGHYKEDTNEFVYNELPEGKNDYDWTLFNKDKEALELQSRLSVLSLFSTSMDFMLSEFLVLCLVPLILKNGQTLGKKLMKLALVSTNEVRVRGWNVFARWAIGIYAFETMINLYFVLTTIIPLPFIITLITAAFTKKGMALHDYIGGTIVVDLNNTIILDNVNDRKKRLLEEKEEFEKIQKHKQIDSKEIENSNI